MPPRTGGTASSGVSELVGSIKQHKKFRQLASYSVQCLCKVITPPHVGWERNLKDAFEAGALTAITDVLTRHKGDEAVLSASTSCLSSMASNPKYAEKLVESGALMSMLESVMSNPEGKEGVKETLNLLETIATHNPEALLKHGGADAATRLIAAAGSVSSPVTAACMRTLEKLNKVPGGTSALMECGAVATIMEMVSKPATDEVSEDVVESSFRTLDRMARTPEVADELRTKMNGMQVLSTALEVHKANDRVCKAGGRVLTKLASGSVTDLISRMDSSKNASEKEFLAGLLANLALEEENADKIVSGGGVGALLKTFDSTSKKTVEASARAISRLAAQNEDNVDDLVRAGAVPKLVTVLASNKDDAGVAASITPTLTRLVNSGTRADNVAVAGGVDAVLGILKAHPEFTEHTVEALSFLEALGTSAYDVTRLVAAGAIPAVVAGMKAHKFNMDVQLNGTRTLIYLSFTETNINAMVTAGLLDVAVPNLTREHKELSIASLYLVTSVALVDAHKATLEKSGGLDKLLTAVATYSQEDAVKETAEELLTSVVGEAQVAKTVKDFSAAVETALGKKTKENSAKVKDLAQRIAALSTTREFAELMLSAKGVASLSHALEAISSSTGMPDLESVLTACGGALVTLSGAVSDDPELRRILVESGAIKGMIASVKAQPKLTTHVQAAVSFLETMSQIPEAEDVIVEEGAIEACVSALRANVTNVAVSSSAINTMLRIAATDKGAVAVAKHGGTRQVIATVAANTGTPGFQQPMEQALTLLQRVAQTSEGAETLVKQGGVDAVIQAADSASRERKGAAKGAALAAAASSSAAAAGVSADGSTPATSAAGGSSAPAMSGGKKVGAARSPVQSTSASVATMLAAGSKVLSRLLTVDDVHSAVDQLAELGTSAKKGRVPAVDAIMPVLTKLTHMATVATYATIINTEGGVKSLATLATVVLTKCEDNDLKGEVLPAVFKTIANLSKHVRIDESYGFAALISQSVEGEFALTECLECISAIASGSEAAAGALARDGKTIGMVVETLRANIRNTDVATSCFQALSAIASHDSTAALVAGTPAMTLVQQWMDDNVEDAAPEAVEAALSTVSNMARSKAHAAQMMDSGALELVKAVLNKVCVESETAVPAVVGASLSVLQRLGSTAASIGKINQSGALRRVVKAMSANSAYMSSELCVSNVMDLIKQAGVVPEVARDLEHMGAQDMIVAGMNANATSQSVVRAGAVALQSLGAGPAAGRAALDDVRSRCHAIETSAEVTTEMVAALGDAVQRLGNFMLLDGVVTAATVPEMMRVVSNAVTLMAASEVASPEVLASAVNCIGRLADVGGAAASAAADDAVAMVMDVLTISESGPVRQAAVATLGILANTAGGLQALNDAGAIDTIVDLARRNPGDTRLQAIVDGTLSVITSSTGRNAAAMVHSAGGAKAIASVVEAASADLSQLESVLMSVSAVAGGDEALFDVISSTGKSDVIGETLRVLREKSAASGVQSIVGNARRVQGLVKSLGAAISAQNALTTSSDTRTKVQALRLAENTLQLMAQCDMDAGGAAAFFKDGGVSSIIQLLASNVDDPETVSKITAILANVTRFTTADGAANLATAENMGTLTALLKLYPDVPDIVRPVIDIMARTSRLTGADASGIDRDAMRAVTQLQAQYGADAALQASVRALQAVMNAKFSESDEAAKAMTSSLAAAASAISSVGGVQELTTEDGRVYYYDSVTNTTSWEMPAAYASFKSAMSAMQVAAARQTEDAVVSVDGRTIETMVATLTQHARNASVATSAAQTLAALAANDANAMAIAKSGGIRAAVAAMTINPDNVALLRVLLALMERISRNDAYKEQVVEAGGLDIIMGVALARHITVDEITLKSLSTIANLAFNSPPNIELIMAKGGVKSVESALQAWPKHARILENAMCALSNLMYGSEENKLTIGQTCGDEVTNIIRDHPSDANLFKMALRALGNLSFCDANIRFIVEEHHATKAIVAGMRAHPKDEEALQLAIEVMGNFASLEEEPPEVDEEGNVVGDVKDTIHMIVLREAGCAEILATAKRFPNNSALLKAAMDALSNVTMDTEVAELMARKQNLIPTVLEMMQSHDWDQELIAHAVPLLATLTHSRECIGVLIQNDVVQTLLTAMEQHGANDHDLLAAAQAAMSNLAATDEARTAIRNMDGVKSILALLETNIMVKAFVEEVMRTFTRLCADDRLSAAIAEAGMHILMQAVEKYERDATFLTSAFRLLGHLAFVETNLTIIVQHSGISRVIKAITNHPDSQALMLRSIQTLDNIAMANKENAAIVIDEGGKELIETIMSSYEDDEDIQRYGKSALLSMSALENLAKSADITSKAVKASTAAKLKKAAEPAKPADPLAEYRHTLSAGKIMKVWTKGTPASAHILVSADFKSIVWQDVKTQKKLGAMDLRQVVSVKAGTGEGHKKTLLGKAVDADCAFQVIGDRSTLDLEANSAKERGTWVDALSKLHTVYRTQPALL